MSGPGPSVTMRIVAEQRKRLVATIMRGAEQSPWWRKLSPDEQADFREDTLSSINVFYELVRDIVKVSEDDGIRNDQAIQLINQVHQAQREIMRAMGEKPVKV